MTDMNVDWARELLREAAAIYLTHVCGGGDMDALADKYVAAGDIAVHRALNTPASVLTVRNKGLVLNDDATNGEEQMTTLNGRPATTISVSACGELDDFWLAMPNIDGRDSGLVFDDAWPDMPDLIGVDMFPDLPITGMTDADVFDLARAELARARAKYPQWPADLVHAAAIASEESGEVVKAVNSYHWQQGSETLEDIRAEAVQAIAMWTRFLVGK